jgi:hypothetical protein
MAGGRGQRSERDGEGIRLRTFDRLQEQGGHRIRLENQLGQMSMARISVPRGL